MTDPVVYNGDTNNFTGVGTPNPKLVIPQKNTFDPPTLAMALSIEQWGNNLVIPPQPAPPTTLPLYIYGCYNAEAAVIDATTNTFVKSITGGSAGPGQQMAISPDGTVLYLINQAFTQNGIVQILIEPESFNQVVSASVDVYGMIQVAADGTTGYVTWATGGLLPFSTTQPPVLGTGISVPDGAELFVLTSDSTMAICAGSGFITPVTFPSTTGTPVALPSAPFGICITPDDKTVAITCPSTNQIVMYDVPSNTIRATSTPAALYNVTSHPNSQTVYAVNWISGVYVDLYAVNVTTASGSSMGTFLPAGSNLDPIIVTPDGQTLYLAEHSFPSTMTPIDLNTVTVGTPFTIPSAITSLVGSQVAMKWWGN